MPAPTVDETVICNLALGWLGARLITSLDDADSVEASLCQSNYATSRDATLEARDWTFASTRCVPNKLADPPAFGFGSAFQLPPDNIRVMQAGADVTFKDDMDWVREKDQILCDEDVIYVRYIFRLEDTQKYMPSFVHACAARLAADLAVPLTNSKDMQVLMANLYIAKLEAAGATDGVQGKNVILQSRRLTRVR